MFQIFLLAARNSRILTENVFHFLFILCYRENSRLRKREGNIRQNYGNSLNFLLKTVHQFYEDIRSETRSEFRNILRAPSFYQKGPDPRRGQDFRKFHEKRAAMSTLNSLLHNLRANFEAISVRKLK